LESSSKSPVTSRTNNKVESPAKSFPYFLNSKRILHLIITTLKRASSSFPPSNQMSMCPGPFLSLCLSSPRRSMNLRRNVKFNIFGFIFILVRTKSFLTLRVLRRYYMISTHVLMSLLPVPSSSSSSSSVPVSAIPYAPFSFENSLRLPLPSSHHCKLWQFECCKTLFPKLALSGMQKKGKV